MTFHLLSEEYKRGAAELSSFGVLLSEDGVPVQTERGDFCVQRQGEGYLVRLRERVQFWPALKMIMDGETGARKSNFDDLTYMLDCSRNAVPKMDALKELIRHLALLGYNSLGLYMEDTFKVEEYPYFGYLRTPFTGEEIKEIEEYCDLFGIELVPYIQTLAHFNTLTRHYAMERLFDTGDILLAGDGEVYRFLDALIGTCAKYFRSRSINIGMDEAYMLGRGRYLDLHGYRPRFDIMAEHLTRVIGICEKYGFRPMMWSDMFFSQAMSAQYRSLPPSVAERLPEGVELIYWDYCSTDEEHYAEMMERHRAFKNTIGFAGGAWKWLGYTPDNRYSFASCAAAARACVKKGIKRFIVTGWGDNGADCSVFATLPALLYCSRMRFGLYETDEAYKRSFRSLAGMDFEDFMTVDLCNRVTGHDDVEEKNSANKYLLFNDVLLGTLDTTVPEGLGTLYGRHARALGAAKKRAGKWAYLFETQYRLARVLELKADMGIRLRRAYRERSAELRQIYGEMGVLLGRVEAFRTALLDQWERENRPNGFDVQDIRIGALKQRLCAAREKLSAYFESGKEIGELNETLLDHMGHGADFEIDPDQCEWRWRRMTSVNMNE